MTLPPPATCRKGFALAGAVILTVVLSIIGAAMLRLGLMSRARAKQVEAELYARNAADGALTLAVFAMNKKLYSEDAWNNETLPTMEETPLILTRSTYQYTVTGNPTDGFELTAQGMHGPAIRRIHATLTLQSPFALGITVRDTITLYPGTIVDAYNSSTQKTRLRTEIGTISTDEDSITIKPGATVLGDVAIGPGAIPDLVVDNRGTIVGEVYVMPEPPSFHSVDAPPYRRPGEEIVVKDGTRVLNPNHSGLYASIHIAGGDDTALRIEGGDVVLVVEGSITLGRGGEIQIAPDGALKVFLRGDLEMKNGAGINNQTRLPSQFTLYGVGDSGQKIDIKANGDFFGSVYAPEGDVEAKAKGELYGSIVANSFTAKSKSDFHYDVALRDDTRITDVGSYFVVGYWREE